MIKKNIQIPVIDLFAGPGGLGEGFSSFTITNENVFRICLSIEKDIYACRTLRLRSFFRKISFDKIKNKYIEFCKSPKSEEDEYKLFSYFKDAFDETKKEVINAELGSDYFSESKLDQCISERLGNAKNWVLIGGPPCQAYSIAGRSRMSRIRKNSIEKYEKDERHYLYQHYLRIIAKHRPPVFVMENVKGIITSKLNGGYIIDKIIKDLQYPSGSNELGYNLYSFVKKPSYDLFGKAITKPDDFIIKAEDYGVPQKRHRVIILGIREDIKSIPNILQKKSFKTVRQTISDLIPIRSYVSPYGTWDKDWAKHIRSIFKCVERREVQDGLIEFMKFNLSEIDNNKFSTGANFCSYIQGRPSHFVQENIRHENLGGVCNHDARCHMPSDLQRYFFAACFAELSELFGQAKSPSLTDFPKSLLPNHKNINKDSVSNSIFDDRFRVQLWSSPASTITSHIAKDGHYYIHPDPCQCRSLTVREAARIQTFPDSYVFLGTRTSQYQQVGNAVPPILAKQLAEIVCKIF